MEYTTPCVLIFSHYNRPGNIYAIPFKKKKQTWLIFLCEPPSILANKSYSIPWCLMECTTPCIFIFSHYNRPNMADIPLRAASFSSKYILLNMTPCVFIFSHYKSSWKHFQRTSINKHQQNDTETTQRNFQDDVVQEEAQEAHEFKISRSPSLTAFLSPRFYHWQLQFWITVFFFFFMSHR